MLDILTEASVHYVLSVGTARGILLTSAISRRAFFKCQLSLLLVVAVGCSAERDPTSEIQAGQTRDEVTAAAGDPDEIDEFTLPDKPFFGPQEGLASVLPAGTLAEEWRYRSAGDVIYVWFVADPAEPREAWAGLKVMNFM